MSENKSSKDMNIQLSRLAITGPIYEYTPICVLVEIADAHGIKYAQKDYDSPDFSNHLYDTIYKTPVHRIGEINDHKSWQNIARFVNKHSQWTQPKLIQAYNFLLEFMTPNSSDLLSKIPHKFSIGLQTPLNPISINACILYKICIANGIHVNPRTNLNQMAYAVKLLRDNPDAILRKAKLFIERDAKRIDLINVLMLSSDEIKDPNESNTDTIQVYNCLPKTVASHTMLERLYQSLTDTRTLQAKIDPSTENGAIALAAINYGIDISRSINAIREYKVLKLAERSNYLPIDPWMSYWYELNPTIFDLSYTFNPLFPIKFYDPINLEIMVRNSGYTNAEIANDRPYELLQLASVSETFYQGPMPNMKGKTTPIDLDNIDDVKYGQLICFGQLDYTLQPITISELSDLFDNNQNFTNPFNNNSVFTSTAINKLKLILSSTQGPVLTKILPQESVEARSELLGIINRIELIVRNTDPLTREFGLIYKNSNRKTKEHIQLILKKLLDIGMYMRGWKGNGEYPVIIAPVPADREIEVAVNITNSISEFEKLCTDLGKIGTQICNLPLVIYKDGEYQLSRRENEGITIKNRINIVKEGEKSTNISSCIRLSSNYISSSAHKYITFLGLPSPFDIFNLRHIS